MLDAEQLPRVAARLRWRKLTLTTGSVRLIFLVCPVCRALLEYRDDTREIHAGRCWAGTAA